MIAYEELDVQDQIGGGGFSIVHRGFWRGTPVAIKRCAWSWGAMGRVTRHGATSNRYGPRGPAVARWGCCTYRVGLRVERSMQQRVPESCRLQAARPPTAPAPPNNLQVV